MQRPVRLKPIHSNSTPASLRRSSPYRPHKSPHEDEQLFHSTVRITPTTNHILFSNLSLIWFFFPLPDGQEAPQTFDNNGGHSRHLAPLPPSHQQLCHTSASSNKEETEWGKAPPQQHRQRSQTAPHHLVHWSWRQSLSAFKQKSVVVF